jgi:hypothetical protein
MMYIIHDSSPQALQGYKSEKTFTRFFCCGRLDSVTCFVPWGMEMNKRIAGQSYQRYEPPLLAFC